MKFNIPFLFIFIIWLFAFSVFAQNDSIDASYKKMIEKKYNSNFPIIKPNEANKKLNNDILFLDTRSKEEFTVSHLPNALFIDYDNFEIHLLDTIPKDREIIIYCSIGVRSQNIGEKLQKSGYTDVKNLYGGIFLWADQGREMTDTSGKVVNKVHGYNKFWGRWVKKTEVVYSE